MSGPDPLAAGAGRDDPVLGPEEDAFLRAHSRTFLLGTRADGSPTGWPMVGLYPGGALEFSTYRRSQKVRDLTRNPTAACVVAPVDDARALLLRGRCSIVEGRHAPATGAANAPTDVPVADEIAQGARARMASGKRIVLRFEPEQATWMPGWVSDPAAERPDG